VAGEGALDRRVENAHVTASALKGGGRRASRDLS
jgi:hypothetical protein